jgi:predicted acetyltransferase
LGKTVFEFEKIQALADKDNTASRCLLEKLGFGYAQDVMVDGKEYQRYLYE